MEKKKMSDCKNEIKRLEAKNDELFLLLKEKVERRNFMDEVEKLREFILEGHCPKAYGFEGPATFPDCGKCVYCKLKKETGR